MEQDGAKKGKDVVDNRDLIEGHVTMLSEILTAELKENGPKINPGLIDENPDDIENVVNPNGGNE